MAWPSLLARTKDWGTEVLTDSDLEGQLDLIVTYINDMMDSSSGHKHDATTAEGPKILVSNLNLTSGAAGDIVYHNGTNLLRLAIGTAAQVLKVNSGATAPEWGTAFTPSASNALTGSVVQVVNVATGAVATGSTAMVDDDTIPQNTEGDEYFTLAITPNSATNKLKIDVVANIGNTAATVIIGAIFQDTTANALCAARYDNADANSEHRMSFTHYMAAGTTSATTFKFRAGGAAGTTTLNGAGGNRKLGGVLISSMTIMEIKV